MRRRPPTRADRAVVRESLLDHLPAPQRAALAGLLRRYLGGHRIRRSDLEVLETRLDRAPAAATATLYHVNERTLYNWHAAGCPRNADGSYDLYQVHEWLVVQERKKHGAARTAAGGTLLEQKMRAEIGYKEAQIAKLRSETVDRSYHEAVLCSRAVALRTYLEQTLPANSYHFVNLNLDEARTRLLRLSAEMMEAWTNAALAREHRQDAAART